ncbi:MAG: aminotransferase class III-fold pyridoxal phosphate-dependent enzyme [Planctomycetes bacterium]|nr:aminotransferase class III-fold pyridoxal phosphate-dependent enzyme [Planctomycetota bacterium]
MTTTRTETTVGQQLRDSRAIRDAIESIVAEVRSRSARITDVRGPIDGAAESYQAFMDRAAQVRGRGLLYPYIGSGVGNGALVELADGSVKWDMICGIGVHFFGHSDPELIEAALLGAIDDTAKHGNLLSNREAFTFAETLLTEASRASRLAHCFLSTGGAMANENALKVCFQKHAPASRVLAFKDCFMGRTVAMSQIGDEAAYRVGIPLNFLVDYIPFYDEIEARQIGEARYIERAVAQLQEYIDRYPGQHACFVFEMIQGEGGFNTAPRAFHEALMKCCKANDIAVWVDEIQTFGRTESMFAFETLDLGPHIDVLCVGKMTQACATLFTEEYNPRPGLLSGTFTGETVSFRVGQRIIERLRDGEYHGPNGANVRHYDLFARQVRAMADRHPDWFPPVPEKIGTPGAADIVGGVGGMMRFTPFAGDKGTIVAACQTCFDEGVILFYCGHDPYHIRMLPPLGVMRDEDWPRVFECVERGLSRAASDA